MSVIMLSGPIGAGKTTVARELIAAWSGPLCAIEGDTFRSFIAKPDGRGRRENFWMLLRCLTASAVPLARCGYDVLLDFSIPPDFLPTAQKILKEIPLDFVVVRPSMSICQARAANRTEGAVADYAAYRDFYALFTAAGRYEVCDDNADARALAVRIRERIAALAFRVNPDR